MHTADPTRILQAGGQCQKLSPAIRNGPGPAGIPSPIPEKEVIFMIDTALTIITCVFGGGSLVATAGSVILVAAFFIWFLF